MGRTDAVQFTLECVAEWRRLGATVTFEAGWETRGNGTSANYEGCNVHHTASPSSLARPFPTRNMLIVGRTGLSGPLCNVATPVGAGDTPTLHVIAAHPANHAGASGGSRTAPMPVSSLFNPRSYGNEIDYAGTVPMSNGQYRAAIIFGRGVTTVLGRSTEYIKAHAETSVTGKWDPGYAEGRTIDMAAFRRDAANLAEGDEFDVTAQEDLADIKAALGAANARAGMPTSKTVLAVQWDIQAALTKSLPLLLKGSDVDEKVIIEGLRPIVVSAVVPAVVEALRDALPEGAAIDEERLAALTERVFRSVLGQLDTEDV